MKTRLLRGYILKFLYEIYPRDIELIGIVDVFYKDWRVASLKKALEYLTDKEYVEKKEIEAPGRKFTRVTIYKLTPKGVDIVEGNLKDNGVLFADDEEEI